MSSKFNVKRSVPILLCLVALFPGCKNGADSLFEPAVSSAAPGNTMPGFMGCVSGSAIDNSTVKVNFEFPPNARKIIISRDGNVIASFDDPNSGLNYYIDGDLREGRTYRYTCDGIFGVSTYRGANALMLTPMLVNPPTFAGIDAVTVLGPNSVKVKWKPASGVIVDHYEVFYKVGSSLDMNVVTPVAKPALGAIEVTVSSLGDELPYTFGVRACSAPEICDANSVTRTVTLPDGGAPKSSGLVETPTTKNGSVTLKAPWTHSDGAVRKRRVFQSFVGGTDMANYTLVKTFDVFLTSPDLTDPPRELTISGLNENTTYHFIVRDEDAHRPANVNTNTNSVAINTGDLTAPAFLGITKLVNGSPSDTVLRAEWKAIASQKPDPNGFSDANGASYYLVYISSAPYPTDPPTPPADPCTNGELRAQLNAEDFAKDATASYQITGLQERTAYRVCIKARDLAGNTSNTTAYLSEITEDITPPEFDGIQTIAYNNNEAQIELTWNPSTSFDAKEYVIKLWKNTATPLPTDIVEIRKPHPGFNSGYNFTAADFPFGQGDRVYALVDAWDDANVYGGAAQHTNYALVDAKSVPIPDITAPQGFLGIMAELDLETPAQGQILVKWFPPAPPNDWSDYRGFTVYTVDPNDHSLTFLQDCACSAVGCPEQKTSCLIENLDAYRTYRLHVRAYDAAGNVTEYLNPSESWTEKKTSDTEAPVFASNLVVANDPLGLKLTWAAVSSDNQYPNEPGVRINYKVYRKTDTTFDVATDPASDPLAAEVSTPDYTSTTFIDPKEGLVEGSTYFYTVCALDASNNTRCDGNVQSKPVPDLTAPVLGVLDTDKKDANIKIKTWKIFWTMSDNVKPTDQLIVTIRKKESDSPVDFPAENAPAIYSAPGILEYANLTGPANAEKYVNYRVTISDGYQTDTETISIFSDNLGPAPATGLAWTQGTAANVSPVNPTWTPSVTPLEAKDKQQVDYYTLADCSGVVALTEDLLKDASTASFPAPIDGSYSYKIKTYDTYDNASTSACSTNMKIDTAAPSVVSVSSSKANGIYTVGDVIPVEVTFSEAVAVTGTPRIEMANGAVHGYAAYSSGSGTVKLTFEYVIVNNDNTADFDYAPVAQIDLNGGTIKDLAGNSTAIALPAAGSAGSLAGSKDIVINTALPSIAITTPDPNVTNYIKPANNVTNYPVSGTCSENGNPVEIKVGILTMATPTCTAGAFSATINVQSLAHSATGTTHTISAKISNGVGPRTATVDVIKDITPPNAPSLLTLAGGLTNPGNDKTPTVRVSGVVSGDTVRLYATACDLINEKQHGVAAGTSIDLAPELELADGNYTFVAMAEDAAGNPSTCSSVSVPYELDSVVPAVTGLTDDAVKAKSKSWAWDCDDTPCTFAYAVNQSATAPLFIDTDFGPTKTASKSGADGRWYLHVQAKDAAGNLSTPVTTVYVDLDNTAPGVATALGWTTISPRPSGTTQVTASWTRDAGTLADLQTQTFALYVNNACTAAASSTVDLDKNQTTRLVNSTDGAKYYFKITSADALGNAATSGCSAMMEIEAPPVRPAVIYKLFKDSAGNYFAAGEALVSGSKRWIVRKSTDAGANWVVKDDFQAVAGQNSVAYGMAEAGGKLYAAGISGTNLIVRRSVDAGENWSTVDQLAATTEVKGIVSDSGGNLFVLAKAGQTIVRKSTNGDLGSWVNAWSGFTNGPLALGTNAARTQIYFTTFHTDDYDGETWDVTDVYRSTDAGATWAGVLSYSEYWGSWGRTFATDSAGNIYIIGDGNDAGNQHVREVYKSASGNAGTWARVHYSPATTQPSALCGDAAGNLYMTTENSWSVYRSVDGGATWPIMETYALSAGKPAAGLTCMVDGASIHFGGRAEDAFNYSHAIVRKSTNAGVGWNTLNDYIY